MMPGGEGGSLAVIGERLSRIEAHSARIDERTQRMEATEKDRWEQTCTRLSDHEQRLRSMEQGWWRPIVAAIPGLGALIATIIGASHNP